MAVGLVVGVLLIAGVVTPIIANVSSDGGGSESTTSFRNNGVDRFEFAGENTHISLYPVDEGKISLEPDSVADRVIYDYATLIFVFEDNSYMDLVSHVRNGGVVTFTHGYSRVDIDNRTMTVWKDGVSSVYSDSVVVFSNPIGDYVDVVSWDENEEIATVNSSYANEHTSVVMAFWVYDVNTEDYVGELSLYGTPESNTVMLYESDTNPEYSPHANISIIDGVLSSVTFTINDTQYVVNPMATPDPDHEYGIVVDNLNFMFIFYVLPVNVTDGEGGESTGTPSESLRTILSVIPLVMTVGLVIGAIGYLRMKN